MVLLNRRYYKYQCYQYPPDLCAWHYSIKPTQISP